MTRSSFDSEKERELRSHLEESPDDADSILELLGMLLGWCNKSLVPEIKSLAQKAVELRPDEALTFVRLAQIEVFERNYEKAIELAQEALSIDPDVPVAKFLIAECTLFGPCYRKKKRREKKALFQEAMALYSEEQRIDERFEIPHSRIANVLYGGQLTKEAHEESLLALKHGKPGVLTKALMSFIYLTTHTFLLAGFLMYVITSFLLVGFFYSWGFVVSVPVTIGVVSFSYFIRNRRTRGIFLAIIISLEVVFIVLALLLWTGYRERAWHVEHPEVETQGEVEELFDFSEVKEGFETPERTMMTWLKSVYEENLPAIWDTFSDSVKRRTWGNDYDEFEKAYSGYLSKLPLSRLRITDIEISDDEGEPGFYWYTIYYVAKGNDILYVGQNIEFTKEGGQYKIDRPVYIHYFPDLLPIEG